MSDTNTLLNATEREHLQRQHQIYGKTYYSLQNAKKKIYSRIIYLTFILLRLYKACQCPFLNETRGVLKSNNCVLQWIVVVLDGVHTQLIPTKRKGMPFVKEDWLPNQSTNETENECFTVIILDLFTWMYVILENISNRT
jgi:hypothetical protein